MKKLIATLGVGLLLASCADKKSFEITVPVPEQFKGQTIVAVNAVNNDTLALATATDSIIRLKGKIEKPVYAYIVCNNMPLTPLVIEPGKIVIDENGVSGTPSNDQFCELISQSTGTEADKDLLLNFMRTNPANPHSIALFEQFMYMADLGIVDTLIACHPDMAERLMSVRGAIETREATSAGGKMVDFTLPDGSGKETSLSSLVENAELTVVDFWASWCGPCRAEIPNLIKLYNEFKSVGLQVVGVDVWEDNDEAGPAAAKQLEIPYAVLYGGTQELTNQYGILGIPTILLIDKSGKIIARDIRGEELQQAVADYLKK